MSIEDLIEHSKRVTILRALGRVDEADELESAVEIEITKLEQANGLIKE